MPDPVTTTAGGARPLATPAAPTQTKPAGNPLRRRLIILSILTAVLALCFAGPLYDLAGYIIDNELFSYIPLIPAVMLYLIWIDRSRLPASLNSGWTPAAIFILAGAGVLAAYWSAVHSGWSPPPEDRLTWMTLSFVLMVVGIAFAVLGSRFMRAIATPVFLLVFTIPYPAFFLQNVEHYLDKVSAAAAYGMLYDSGAHVLRNGMLLTLPDVAKTATYPHYGLTLKVAPECSGIHSSLILLITSIIAGCLFLRSPWKRAALTLFVFPLAILRNGFRIFTLGELCIHMDGTMIDSPIHHQGGPIFFALSMIPFLLLLVQMHKSESKTPDVVQLEKQKITESPL